MQKKILFILIVISLFINNGAAFCYTKEDIIARGRVNCGVSFNSPGFSELDVNGVWRGLHSDICRAIAVAVLGDKEKVRFIPFKDTGAYTALLSGKVDLLLQHGTGANWNFTRDTALAINFAGVSFYDQMGLLFLGEEEELAEKKAISLCSFGNNGNSAAVAVLSFLEKRESKIKKVQEKIQIVEVEKRDIAEKLFFDGKCSLIVEPVSRLITLQKMVKGKSTLFRGKKLKMSGPFFSQHILFGPVVRHGDEGWFDIVRWTLFMMIAAEEYDITSTNIAEKRLSSELEPFLFLGAEDGGTTLGLAEDWAVQIIEQVGNYGEVFSRNLGADSELNFTRGINALWSDGGLLYSPPIQ